MCWTEPSLGLSRNSHFCYSLDHSRNSRRAIRGSNKDTGPEVGIFCRAPLSCSSREEREQKVRQVTKAEEGFRGLSYWSGV